MGTNQARNALIADRNLNVPRDSTNEVALPLPLPAMMMAAMSSRLTPSASIILR